MGSLVPTSCDAALSSDSSESRQALPVELVLQIASHLSRKDIKNLRSVNKYWNRVLLEPFGRRCFDQLNVLASARSREVLVRASQDKRLSCYVRCIYIRSALALVQFVQKSGDFNNDASFAPKSASPFQRINTITCLTGFENLKSLYIKLGIPDEHKNAQSPFIEGEIQIALCNMINALGPRLNDLSLSNGVGPDRIPIDSIVRRINFKGIRYIILGCSWGLRTELIDQLEDCKGTLEGLTLEIYHPVPGKDRKLWRDRSNDLHQTLDLEYLNSEFLSVSKSEFLSHIPPGMIANGIRAHRPREQSTRRAWNRKVIFQIY